MRRLARRLGVLGSLLCVIGAVCPVRAADLRALVSPYLDAFQSNAVGYVDGRASGEARRPTDDPVPWEGVSVLLVPFAAQIEAGTDVVKARFRDSLTAYAGAEADLAAVRQRYERDLHAAGAGELIRRAESDASGGFWLGQVPAGEWLLLAWREEPHPLKGAPRALGKDASRFREMRVPTGYVAVSYWRMRVSVRVGELTAVTLSDRGVWLTAVREQFANPSAKPGSPPAASGTGADPGQRR